MAVRAEMGRLPLSCVSLRLRGRVACEVRQTSRPLLSGGCKAAAVSAAEALCPGRRASHSEGRYFFFRRATDAAASDGEPRPQAFASDARHLHSLRHAAFTRRQEP